MMPMPSNAPMPNYNPQYQNSPYGPISPYNQAQFTPEGSQSGQNLNQYQDQMMQQFWNQISNNPHLTIEQKMSILNHGLFETNQMKTEELDVFVTKQTTKDIKASPPKNASFQNKNNDHLIQLLRLNPVSNSKRGVLVPQAEAIQLKVKAVISDLKMKIQNLDWLSDTEFIVDCMMESNYFDLIEDSTFSGICTHTYQKSLSDYPESVTTLLRDLKAIDLEIIESNKRNQDNNKFQTEKGDFANENQQKTNNKSHAAFKQQQKNDQIVNNQVQSQNYTVDQLVSMPAKFLIEMCSDYYMCTKIQQAFETADCIDALLLLNILKKHINKMSLVKYANLIVQDLIGLDFSSYNLEKLNECFDLINKNKKISVKNFNDIKLSKKLFSPDEFNLISAKNAARANLTDYVQQNLNKYTQDLQGNRIVQKLMKEDLILIKILTVIQYMQKHSEPFKAIFKGLTAR